MGSTSDLPILRKAADFLEQMQVPFELLALSAHRTPTAVEKFATEAQDRGIKVIIAAAGMAAALPGVIAALTPLPVIGLPIDSTLQGQDALLSIVMMPPGIPVATVGINAGMNAAVLAVRILSLTDADLAARYKAWTEGLNQKILRPTPTWPKSPITSSKPTDYARYRLSTAPHFHREDWPYCHRRRQSHCRAVDDQHPHARHRSVCCSVS